MWAMPAGATVNTAYVYGDGFQFTTTLQSTGTTQSINTGTGGGTTIAGFPAVGWFANIVVSEILHFSNELSTAQRQQIEGYLAQKWGLVSQLPSIHPYGTSPAPATLGFLPTEISGCQLWLDAADRATVSMSGDTVTGWRDKSGNGLNFTAAGTPTFGSAGITLTEGAVLTSISNIDVTATTYVYVVSQVSTIVNGSGYVVAFGGINGGDFSIRFNTNGLIGTAAQPGNADDFAAGNYYVNSIFNPSTVTYSTYTVPNIISAKCVGTEDRIGNTPVSISSYFYGRYFVGNVYEVLIYASEPTTLQRQQIEGYLAWKWGLNTSLLAGHPFKIGPPYPRPFSPRDITGCQLWLDAADTTNMTLVSGNVSQLNDKSGNGRNLTQATAGNRPSYVIDGGRPYLNFVTASSNFLSNTAMTIDYRTSYIFLVFKRRANNNNGLFSALINGRTNNDWANADEFIITNLVEVASAGSGANDAQGANTNLTNYAFAINNNSLTTFRDFGTTSVITRSMGLTGIPNALYLGIRRDGASLNYPFDGFFGEAIVYNRILTASEYQSVQGYLAWKWDLQLNLPPIHIFKNRPPYAQQFQPSDISGCVFWLDGKDRSTLTLSGTDVSSWTDKSGTGTLVTQSVLSNRPTYSSADYSLSFNASNFLNTNYIGPGSNESLFVVFSSSNSTRETTILGAANDAYGNRALVINQRGVHGNFGINSTNYGSGPSIGGAFSNVRSIGSTAVISNSTAFAILNGTPSSVAAQLTFSNANMVIGGELIGGQLEPTEAYVGKIYEVIGYNRLVTLTERQQVEAYLAWRWGAVSLLPITHPFKYTPPTYYIPPFTPTNIAGCQLWLDAADASNVTLATTTTVSAWLDKSGRGNNMTGLNSPTYTTLINGNRTITTNGTNQMLSNTTFTLPQPFTAFVVCTLRSSGGGYAYVLEGTVGPSATVLHTPVTSSNLAMWAGTSNVQPSPAVAFASNVPRMYTAVFNGANSALGINSTITTGLDPGTNAKTGARFGANWANVYQAADWAEVILYDSVLSTYQRQTVENYLAWKWGLNASIPVQAPTKPMPLYTRPCMPLDISGCTLWLDAADIPTLTRSGTLVTGWADKSGNARNAAGTVSPTYDSVGRFVTFNGTSHYFTLANSSFPFGNTPYSIMYVAYTTSPNTPQWVFQAGSEAVTGAMIGGLFYYNNAVWHSWWVDEYRADYTVTANVPLMINLTFGSIRSTIVNGSVVATGGGGTRSSPNTTNFLGKRGAGEFFTGGIGEFIVYDRELTTFDRQRVESYLARKWGLLGSLPSNHQFRPAPALTTVFNPMQIPGAIMWIDAADPSTMTFSGSNVTDIRDKTRSILMSVRAGNNASFLTLLPNAIQGRSALFFNNSAAENVSLVGPMAAPGTFCSFVVWRNFTQRSSAYRTIYTWEYRTASPNPGSFAYGYPGTQTGATLGIWDTWTGGGGSSTIAVANATNYIGYTQYPSPTLSVNGAVPANSAKTVNTTAQLFSIAGNPGISQSATMYLGEILIYNTILSVTQRQQVEGYLAWKWGMTGSFPGAHPYCKVIP